MLVCKDCGLGVHQVGNSFFHDGPMPELNTIAREVEEGVARNVRVRDEAGNTPVDVIDLFYDPAWSVGAREHRPKTRRA